MCPITKELSGYNLRTERVYGLRGFTIVELLVVIVVIGILAAITIIAYNGILQRANLATLQSDMVGAAKILEISNINAGTYPADLPTAGLKASSGTSYRYTYISGGNSYCLTGSNNGVTYTASSASPTPSAGICPNSGVVTSLAGANVGTADGTGTVANFSYPAGMAIDSSGTLYVADSYRIRKVTAAGVVTTIAGSSQGFAEGTGAAAQFSSLYSVAIDSSGNLYVGDTGNNRIRKITSAGVVSTVAGSGTASFADGTGTSAMFNTPFGIAVDSSSTLYVADVINNRIRKITSAGVVSTLAGSGARSFANGTGTSAMFSYPRGVAVDSLGNVYVADTGNQMIRKITSGGVVTTLAGATTGFADGTGTSALFYNPLGIAVDNFSTVYVGDGYNYRIRTIQ